jgi:hypothetical protein
LASSVAVTRENHIFKKHDFVRIINDQSRIKRLQRGHGEWADVMAKSLNKIGKIIDIYHDDDLKVLINGSFWTYNPAAVRFVFSFSASTVINANFLLELVQLIKESNSPIDALWEGILISNIELVRKNLKIIPENYQAPNSLETQVPEHHVMHGFRNHYESSLRALCII